MAPLRAGLEAFHHHHTHAVAFIMDDEMDRHRFLPWVLKRRGHYSTRGAQLIGASPSQANFRNFQKQPVVLPCRPPSMTHAEVA
jgi:hypothetical protein